MEIVLIPVYQRPEFLYYCLDQIKKAFNAANYHYVFQIDVGYDPAILPIIRKFPFSKELMYTEATGYGLMKQSYSLLKGYMYSSEKSDNLVYLIEEDIMIASDFFLYHTEVQKNEIFCSLSTENTNSKIHPTKDIDKYYFSTGDYNSLGVCFKKSIIIDYIKPHFIKEYMITPVDYLQKKFPGSKIGKFFAEQDGLIRRVQETSGLPTVYPCTPRAYHAGYYGKNRGKKHPSRDLKSRIAQVGSIIFDNKRMKAHALNPEYYEDSKPVNLNIEPQIYLPK